MELTPGTMIAGRYRIDARVGAGGMGEVWVGEHLAVGARVALKTLLPAAAINHEVVARFKREAYFLGRIRSDHVARVVDFVADEAVGLVLVMEYIEGDPLSKILQQKTLTVEEAVELGADIVTALRDLHQAKIIHRDLKPGNIIIQRRYDGSFRAVIVDFGVSRIASNGAEDEEMTGITRADMAVGTIEYMAPEQILNSRDVTPASDLYAVGAILFRAVAGHHVFGDLYDVELAKTKLTKDPGGLHTGRGDRVAKGLEQVVAKALKRRPKERYDSADKLLADLIVLRDLARAIALDLDQATTQDGARNSIPVVVDSTSSPSVTRPRMTSASSLQAGGPPSVGPGAHGAHGAHGTHGAHGAHGSVPVPSGPPSGRPSSPSVVPGEPSVTLQSTRPSSHGGNPSSAEGMAPAPRRRGVPLIATVALVLVALAGGATLAVFLMKGRLPHQLLVPAAQPASVEPVEPAAPATAAPAAPAPSAEPSAEPSAAPTADASAAPDTPIDLDEPAPSGSMPGVAAARTPRRPAPAPVAVAAPKPASPSATAPAPAPAPAPSSSPSPSPSPSFTAVGTSPPAAPASTPKTPSSAATSSPPKSAATSAPTPSPLPTY